MAEPVSTTGAAVSLGLTALLIGWFGPIAADVMMVIMSAIAGCAISLSNQNGKTLFGAIKFIALGILLSLVTSWMLASLVSQIHPAINGPYLPSVIAFAIGAMLDKIPFLRSKLIARFGKHIEGESS